MASVSQITVDNQGFSAFRTAMNNSLNALNTLSSASSAPGSKAAGSLWLDTTSATTPTLKFYDGSDWISLCTFDYSANTVNWLDSTVSLGADSVDSDQYVDGSIDNIHLADNAVDTEEIADNAVSLAKMAGGTDGNIISYDASGDPVAIATGTDGQVLTSAGAGAPPAFEDSSGFSVSTITGATELAVSPAQTDEIIISDGGVLKRVDVNLLGNAPYFYAFCTNNQVVTNYVETKVELDDLVFESHAGSFDDTTNFRFTVPTGEDGKYLISANMLIGDAESSIVGARLYLKPNGGYGGGGVGAKSVYRWNNTSTTEVNHVGLNHTAVWNLAAGDYIEMYAWVYTGDAGTVYLDTQHNHEVSLSGFKLAGSD